jgi:hypothetical protein
LNCPQRIIICIQIRIEDNFINFDNNYDWDKFYTLFLVGTAQVIPSGAPILGQRYTVTCNVHVFGKLCPLIFYKWTKDNGTVAQLEAGIEPNTLSLSPLRLSDAGLYTCLATVRSFRIANDVTVTGTHKVRIQGKLESD